MTDYQCKQFNLSGGTPAVCRKLRRVSGIAVSTCVYVIGSRLSTCKTGVVSLDALVTVSGIVGTNIFPLIFITICGALLASHVTDLYDSVEYDHHPVAQHMREDQ